METVIELKAKAIAAENKAKAEIELYYSNLKTENERLNNIIKELDSFLDKQIEKENKLLNPKKGIKPYGDEKFYYEIYKSCLFDIKFKLNKLKENK